MGQVFRLFDALFLEARHPMDHTINHTFLLFATLLFPIALSVPLIRRADFLLTVSAFNLGHLGVSLADCFFFGLLALHFGLCQRSALLLFLVVVFGLRVGFAALGLAP